MSYFMWGGEGKGRREVSSSTLQIKLYHLRLCGKMGGSGISFGGGRGKKKRGGGGRTFPLST